LRPTLTACEGGRGGTANVARLDAKLEAGGWRLEAGGWRLEAGGWRLEAGGWRLKGWSSRVAHGVDELELLRRVLRAAAGD
jgi:hypothetical protein